MKWNDPKRWWFLEGDGWKEFESNPVAQGYEVIARNPGFPHLKVSHGHACWEHANMDEPRRSWRQLPRKAQRAFYHEFKHDLHRMGFAEICYLGPRKLTFDCTEGDKSILKAVERALETSGRPRTGYRTRFFTRLLGKEPPPKPPKKRPLNKDMVTILWSELFRKWRKTKFVGCSELMATLQTFLQHDPEYRAYREQRLRLKWAKHSRKWPKMCAPEVVALGAVAWDWKHAGHPLSKLWATVKGKLSAIQINHAPEWRNMLRRMRELHKRSALDVPPTHPYRKVIDAPEDINVNETLNL